MSQKRYAVTVDFYIWADDDEDAIKQAHQFAAEQCAELDNSCHIISIHELPFASINNKKIFPK